MATYPQGQFRVVEARRDTAIGNAEAQYQPDDPLLLNRIVTFADSGVSFDGDTARCAKLIATDSQTTLANLFRQAIIPRSSPNYARFATPADFDFHGNPMTKVTATRFRCVASVHKGEEWNRAAWFPLGLNRWALTWAQNYVLVLTPINARHPVSAGFDCTKARALAERTICSDNRLAGWDRSVSVAYKATQEEAEDANSLQIMQKKWLSERSSCGVDKTCLVSKMQQQYGTCNIS